MGVLLWPAKSTAQLSLAVARGLLFHIGRSTQSTCDAPSPRLHAVARAAQLAAGGIDIAPSALGGHRPHRASSVAAQAAHKWAAPTSRDRRQVQSQRQVAQRSVSVALQKGMAHYEQLSAQPRELPSSLAVGFTQHRSQRSRCASIHGDETIGKAS